jgi:aquaporin Z
MRKALQHHWPEYGMEAAGLGVFVLSACVCVTLLQHPTSPVAQVIQQPLLRRFLIGLAMALTAISIIYSPWGKQSGAHLNPSVTLTFFRLGKVAPWDALWYILAQFVGGILGVGLAVILLRPYVADPTVNYIVTAPGRFGPWVAFVAEVLISFVLMSVVLRVSNNRTLNRFTGLCAGLLVATYITLEAPLSGMSMNPARTFGSALSAQVWTALWIYFLAPPLGMLLAAEQYVRWHGAHRVLCAKLHHHNTRRCIFHCSYAGVLPASAYD